jgi:hypothetical protein
MGNDGGSIPDRRDLVRNKPKVLTIYKIPTYSANQHPGGASGQGEPNARQVVLLCTVKGTCSSIVM